MDPELVFFGWGGLTFISAAVAGYALLARDDGRVTAAQAPLAKSIAGLGIQAGDGAARK